MDKYLVFSLKLSAWWGGQGSPYTSNLSQARRFDGLDAAIIFCKKHYDNQTGLGAIPVREADITAVMTK